MKKIDIDYHKLDWHTKRVKQWLKTGDTIPIYVEIGPTNICNHNCIFCGFDYARGTDTLETKNLIKTISSMAKFGIKSILYAGAGEPFLHKDFPLIVEKTKKSGIDVAFSTNTSLFDEVNAEKTLPYVSWIRHSIDAATPVTHKLIHRPKSKGDCLEGIFNNLKKAVEIKKRNNYNATLGVQTILLEENSSEILNLAEICREIGVDALQIKPYSKHPPSIKKIIVDYNNFKGLEEKLKYFQTDDFNIVFRQNRMQRITQKKDFPYCLSLPFWSMINERGDVVPCDLFYDNQEFSYGNIYTQTFPEIWNGEKRQKTLKKIKQRGTKNCKEGCRGDLINSFLWDLKNKKIEIKKPSGEPPLHINFI